MHDSTRPYRGRFAPSPTGPLHFGSLVAAVGSYLEARWNRGRWLVRMEDLERPREARGAAIRILSLIKLNGSDWTAKSIFHSRPTGPAATPPNRRERDPARSPSTAPWRKISDPTDS